MVNVFMALFSQLKRTLLKGGKDAGCLKMWQFACDIMKKKFFLQIYSCCAQEKARNCMQLVNNMQVGHSSSSHKDESTKKHTF